MGWTFVIDTCFHLFEQQAHGHLVAITSAGGLRGEPMAPAYSATKAYQINYMEALRKKAFKAGGKVIVTGIRPGLHRPTQPLRVAQRGFQGQRFGET
jgi:short-subunit dehydrogenase